MFVKNALRLGVCLGAILSFYILASFQIALALDAKALFKNTRNSVVMVMSFDSNQQPLAIGSGFFVGDGKAVVTNHHVIENGFSVKLKLVSGQVLTTNTVLGVDVDHDIVLLSVPQAGQPLKLAKRTPEVGEDIVVIGNPKGLEGSLSAGIISGVREAEGSLFYQITAPISPGSSGGPVIGEEGQALGVASFYVSGGQNLNFAMPVAYVHRLLRSPRERPLSKVATKKTRVGEKSIDERVKVVEPFIDGLNNTLQASVVNGSNGLIKDIRIVAVFSTRQNPVHYMLIGVTDSIPPGLAIRFERKDSALGGHGHAGLWDRKGRWDVSFRVLDYDIVEQPGGDAIPTFK